MADFPLEFKEMIKELLGEESDDFLKELQKEPVVSVRLNKRKPVPVFQDEQKVTWCENGRYLNQRPVFTLDPLLHAGAYYVQEASSMIYEPLISKIIKKFQNNNSSSSISLLDMCAAPGGKTTAIINAVPDGTSIVANAFVKKRFEILKENLIKWGYPDVTATNLPTSSFAEDGPLFDIVSVDAPCSGEGMMRKEETAVRQWTPALVEQCAELQKKILKDAVSALRDGGFLVYSTCTFNRKENEENAEFLRSELGLIPFDPEFPEEWGIQPGIKTDLPVLRFLPHKTKGEGLFVAVFRKPGEWKSKISKNHVNLKNLKVQRKADIKFQEVPDIKEILSTGTKTYELPSVELSTETALSYLRREAIVLPPETPKGIIIVKYLGLPLGPVKNIGQRANNLFPKNWRILMRE